MNTTYEKELRSLQNWIENANMGLATVGAVTTDTVSANNIYYQISTIADGIVNEYPFYATELNNISKNLFRNSAYGSVALNSAAFGELFVIIHHIIKEPVDMSGMGGNVGLGGSGPPELCLLYLAIVSIQTRAN